MLFLNTSFVTAWLMWVGSVLAVLTLIATAAPQNEELHNHKNTHQLDTTPHHSQHKNQSFNKNFKQTQKYNQKMFRSDFVDCQLELQNTVRSTHQQGILTSAIPTPGLVKVIINMKKVKHYDMLHSSDWVCDFLNTTQMTIGRVIRSGDHERLVVIVECPYRPGEQLTYLRLSGGDTVFPDVPICPYVEDETNYQRYFLSACTSVRREPALAIAEWIEFHKLMGVEFFLMYLDEDYHPDSYKELLPYVQEGTLQMIIMLKQFLFEILRI